MEVVGEGVEVLAEEQCAGSGVVQDERQFATDEPPVEGDDDHAGQRGAVEGLGVLVAVGGKDGDPVPGAEPESVECGGDLGGATVDLGVGVAASGGDVDDRFEVGAHSGPAAQMAPDVGDECGGCGDGHGRAFDGGRVAGGREEWS